ncbi:MAG: hypothetical protein ACE5H0_08145, partial [Bacteroidota bacterium]
MKFRNVLFLALSLALLASCAKQEPEGQRVYSIERIGPARVVQLYADGFESLPTREKIFLYYLSQAAIAGRDIAIDQHHCSALEVRDILEGILTHPEGINTRVLRQITHYTKLFWINDGMYDNLTSSKFVPMCSEDEFKIAAKQAEQNGARFGSAEGESLEQKIERLKDVIFNADYEPILTNKTPGQDWIKESTVNFYGKDVTYDEVDRWARAGREKNPLNSKVVKKDGRLIELVWRAGGEDVPPGMYAADLEVCIEYLEMAIPYAANEYQQETIRKLIRYY